MLAAENAQAVLVLDLHTGKLEHAIQPLQRPHAILLPRGDNRIFVTDGGVGALRVFNATDYAPLKTIPLLVDADSITYDAAKHLLYIVNGGGDAHQTYSMINVVNTATEAKAGEVKVDGDTLEALRLEPGSSRLFVNVASKNEVAVIDRDRLAVTGTWPVTGGKRNVAMGLDAASHRLFLGCRDGHLVVMDTGNGKEVASLPIDPGVDDIEFDAGSRRIYASSGGASGQAGSVSVYQEESADQYRLLGKVATAPGARNSLLSASRHRYYVSVPQHGTKAAEVLVYQVQ